MSKRILGHQRDRKRYRRQTVDDRGGKGLTGLGKGDESFVDHDAVGIPYHGRQSLLLTHQSVEDTHVVDRDGRGGGHNGQFAGARAALVIAGGVAVSDRDGVDADRAFDDARLALDIYFKLVPCPSRSDMSTPVMRAFAVRATGLPVNSAAFAAETVRQYGTTMSAFVPVTS